MLLGMRPPNMAARRVALLPPIGWLTPRPGRTVRAIDRATAAGVILSLIDPDADRRRTTAQVKAELRRLGLSFVSLPDFEGEMTTAADLLFRAAQRERETPEELQPDEEMEALSGLVMAMQPDEPSETDRHYAAEQDLAPDLPLSNTEAIDQ